MRYLTSTDLGAASQQFLRSWLNLKVNIVRSTVRYLSYPSVAIVKLSFVSGFGFVSFVDYADSERAVQELNGKELDSRIIRVEKARRASGYEKTPGRCKIILGL